MSLYLEKIDIFQFKNHSVRSFFTDHKAVAFVGENGRGKTNVLEAIYYLCFTKNFTSVKDNDNIMWGKDGFRISGKFVRNSIPHSVKIVCSAEGKKSIIHNENPIRKYADFIGEFPAVLVAPDSMELINVSALRRKYIDGILSQIDREYLRNLQIYNKILVQKNSLLKHWKRSPNKDLLHIYNSQLNPLALFIYAARKEILPVLLLVLQDFYKAVASQTDALSVHYDSVLDRHSWEHLTEIYTEKEIITQRSLFGVHKDDILFFMNGKAFKNTASQGQKKT